jgi:hypothetical protein
LHCIQLHCSQTDEGSARIYPTATQPLSEIRYLLSAPAIVGFLRIAGANWSLNIYFISIHLTPAFPFPVPSTTVDSQPPLCIYLIPSERSFFSFGDEDRLPSASTCFNLLKLPPYKSSKVLTFFASLISCIFPHFSIHLSTRINAFQQVLREKLLYAITSGAGFELS